MITIVSQQPWMGRKEEGGGLGNIPKWRGVEAEWLPQSQFFQETPFSLAAVGMGIIV